MTFVRSNRLPPNTIPARVSPVPQGRIIYLNLLYDSGNEIHYWTARGSVTGIDRKQLTENQLTNQLVLLLVQLNLLKYQRK